MRTTPNYFKFRQWLHKTICSSYQSNDDIHADDLYQDSAISEYEIIPAGLIFSGSMLILNYARKFYYERSFAQRIPTLYCHLQDIENYDSCFFEYDNSIPDFSTLEKTAAHFPQNTYVNISFYATSRELMRNAISQGVDNGYMPRRIHLDAPSWFGAEYNMIYEKILIHSNKSYGCFISHRLEFYHSDETDFFPFEKNQWIDARSYTT